MTTTTQTLELNLNKGIDELVADFAPFAERYPVLVQEAERLNTELQNLAPPSYRNGVGADRNALKFAIRTIGRCIQRQAQADGANS